MQGNLSSILYIWSTKKCWYKIILTYSENRHVFFFAFPIYTPKYFILSTHNKLLFDRCIDSQNVLRLEPILRSADFFSIESQIRINGGVLRTRYLASFALHLQIVITE